MIRLHQVRMWHPVVQIIAPEQDKYIKRTPDGTPMEVALTKDLRHPNIVQALRHASFMSQVYLLYPVCIQSFCASVYWPCHLRVWTANH